MSRFSRERWDALLARLGVDGAPATFLELERRYSEVHRKYHNVDHIADCLQKLDDFTMAKPPMLSVARPDEIELAIWFHDAVYDPLRRDNEQRSQEWAARFLQAHHMSDALVTRVTSAILATRHDRPPAELDHQILVDVDLSILGCEPALYERFETEIRAEYRWVPWFLFRSKRAEILSGFLARKRIYATEWFASRYEREARANLSRAIATLRRPVRLRNLIR